MMSCIQMKVRRLQTNLKSELFRFASKSVDVMSHSDAHVQVNVYLKLPILDLLLFLARSEEQFRNFE